jgi:hypothetical protein
MVVLNRLGARTYEALLLGWGNQMLQSADLIEDEELRLRLFVKSNEWGVMNPGRMLIETFYPCDFFVPDPGLISICPPLFIQTPLPLAR